MRLGTGLRTLSLSRMLAVVGLMCLLSLLAASCSLGLGSPPTRPIPQVLRLAWAMYGAPDMYLDPTTNCCGPHLNSSNPIINLVFDGLVTLDKHLYVINWGADSVTPSPDGLTYVFHLRPGQKFSDGTPVHASDYAYAMDRSENPCIGSSVNYYLFALVDAVTFSSEQCDSVTGRITAPYGQKGPVITTLIGDSILPDDGAGTLTLKLAAPAGYFLAALTYSTAFALERSVVTGANNGADEQWRDNLARGATGQGGSGMFYVSKWDHKGSLVLKANPYWWGRTAGLTPKLTELDYTLFQSVDSAYAAYNADISGTTYGVSSEIPAAQLAAARRQADFHTGPSLGYQGVAMNFGVAPFDNVDARAAFCLAINRDEINATVESGADIPTWHLVPQGTPGYYTGLQSPDNAPTTGNQQPAVQKWHKYLATLHGAASPTIQYTYNFHSQTETALAKALIATWNQVLGTHVQGTDVFSIHPPGRVRVTWLQMYPWGWYVDYPDPQDFLTMVFVTTSTYNDNNSGSPAIDALMTKADALSDPSLRFPLYNEAEQDLITTVADCPLFQFALHYQVRSYVSGYVLDAVGTVPTTEWPHVAIHS